MKLRFPKIILSFFLILFTGFSLLAIEEKTSAQLESANIPNGNIVIKDVRYDFMNSNSNWNQTFCIAGSKAIISLINNSESPFLYVNNWSINLPYTAVFKDETGAVLFTESHTLSISSDNVAGVSDKIGYDAFETSPAASHFVRVDITAGTPVFTGLTEMPEDIVLKGEIQIERYFEDLRSDIPVVSVNNFTTTFSSANAYGLNYTGSDNRLEINWTEVDGVEYYDLEYLFVDIGGNDENDPFNYDFAKATRVNLNENTYTLPLAFPKGWMLYRVRGVSKSCAGVINYGEWSSYASGSGLDQTRASDFNIPVGASQEQLIGWHGLESGLNWVYSTSFAEEGKRNSGLVFFDGSNHDRQGLSEYSTQDELLVGTTLYDYQGRPAVKMLAAPIVNDGPKYYGPMDYYATNEPFSRKHFDLNLGYPNAITNSGISSGASNYFSADNPLSSDLQTENIPEAGGFPYVQTRYEKDGTNRVKSQSDVGPDHAIGSGHETRFMYGSLESQQDLDRLFGNNAGYYKNYTKEVLTDANNVSKVIYKNQAGVIVATALAGGVSSNLSDVDYAPAAEIILGNILANVRTNDNSLVTTTKSLVTVSRVDNIEYGFPKVSYPAPTALDACFTEFGAKDIRYDLSIQLFDEDDQSVSLGTNYPSGVELNFITEALANDDGNLKLEADLASGSYTLTKKVKVNAGAADVLKEQFKKFVIDNAVICGLVDPLSNDDPCSCEYICETSVVTDFVNGTAPNVWTIPGSGKFFDTKQKAIDDCILGCNAAPTSSPVDECEMLRSMLLEDVSPGGQYFDNIPNSFERSADGSLSAKDPSAYDEDNWLKNLYDQNGVNHSLGSLTFLDGSGNTVNNVTLANIRALWEDSFAETLLPFHPEFCAYEEYCGEVDVWDYSPITSTGINSKDYTNLALLYKEFNPLNLGQNLSSSLPTVYQPHPSQSGTPHDLWLNHPQLDHAFVQSPGALGSLSNYMLNYLDFGNGVIHNIWYFLDDPANIAGGMGGVTDPNILGLYQKFHGDGTQTNGYFYDGTFDKFTVFFSAYNFFRSLILYEQVKNNCNGMPFGSGDNVPNLSAQTFGRDYDFYQIRFPKSLVYENYISGGVNALQSAGIDQYNNAVAADSDPETYETSCVCGNLDLFVVENQYVSSGTLFSDITDAAVIAQIASDLSTQYGYTISATNVLVWQAECKGTTKVGIETLLTNNAFPLSFLCGQIQETSCVCNNILNLINEVTGIGYPKLSDVIVDANLEQGIQEELNNNSITQADIETWIRYCGDLDSYPLEDWVELVYNKQFSHTLFCYEYASKECGCARLLSSDFLSEDAFSEGENLADLTAQEKIDFVAALNSAGYAHVTLANVNEWINSCSGTTTTSLSDLVIYQNLPSIYLCFSEALFDIDVLTDDPCADIRAQNEAVWQEELEKYADEMADAYMADYYEYALNHLSETYTRGYSLNEYAYTLYYYDLSGNLTMTVPAKGVNILPVSQRDAAADHRKDPLLNPFVQDSHDFKTRYRYNSLNRLIWQETPDGGQTYFWYDKLGRLVLSQNDKQDENLHYSYSIYDGLGRMSETGQIHKPNWTPSTNEYDDLVEICENPTQFANFLSVDDREEIMFIYYNTPIFSDVTAAFNGDGPHNLQNRMASVLYIEEPINGSPFALSSSPSTQLPAYLSAYHNATHYSYDIHGNVKKVIQDIPSLKRANKQYFTTEYEYDLLTKNINQVSYQAGSWDQYYHRYTYDAENRLQKVETSKDKYVWAEDASYEYYPHGPLARIELGHEQVQGMDYAYTIHGWLKGVNSAVLNASKDIGRDGDPNYKPNTAKDVFGFTLDFYNGDYSSIGRTDFVLDNTSSYTQKMGSPLYNGNVSRMTTALMDNQENLMDISAMAFEYDQLNRIKRSGSILTDGVAPDLASASFTDAYFTEYTFDLNGNFTGLIRKDEVGDDMDNLNYQYLDVNGNGSNRLDFVLDSDGFFDKKDLGEVDQEGGNYEYDDIGNLTRDISEDIDLITWTVAGKIKEIQFNNDKDDIEFHYNAEGHRITKVLKTKTAGVINSPEEWEYQHYIRNSSGKSTMIYKESIVDNGSCYQSTFTIDDIPIYSGSRIGSDQKPSIEDVVNFSATISNNKFTSVNTSFNLTSNCANLSFSNGAYAITHGSLNFGNKRYELGNHLGNVLSVITDRKNLIISDPNEVLKWYPIEAGINDFEVEEGDVMVEAYDPQSNNLALSPNHEYELCIQANFTGGTQLKADITTDNDPSTLQTVNLINGSNCYQYTGVSQVAVRIYETYTTSPLGYHIESFSIERSRCFDCYFEANVLSAQDYYPYGMEMPGRSFNSGDYRFGFNGKEKDDEIKGTGNSYNFGARIHDPRIGRFLSLDPMAGSFPWMSPYVYAANTPISAIDEDGKFANFAIKYGIDVGINIATQMLVAYMFEDNVNSVGAAWDKVSLFDAFGEGLADQLGTKKLRMAANATMGVLSYIDRVGMANATFEGMLLNGGIGLLEPIIGDVFAKHGIKVVVRGLKKMGLDSRVIYDLTKELACFTKGTLVEVEDGSIPIEKIEIGDKVWSYNVEEGKTELKEVVKTFMKKASRIYTISIDGEKIEVTEEHPFYVKGDWVPSKSLKVGDELLLFSGKKAEIKSITFEDRVCDVFNFEVSGNHNYFVSNQKVLVHNKCVYDQWQEAISAGVGSYAFRRWKRAAAKRLDLGLRGKVDDKLFAHHIIPLDVLVKNNVLRRAAKQGFDINHPDNGILINKLVHNGPHFEWTQSVKDYIKANWKNFKGTEREFVEQELLPYFRGLADKAKATNTPLNQMVN